MNTYIALLRGINVAGQKKILMAEFRAILEKNGFLQVQTYIQSGNVVFNHPSNDVNEIATLLEKVIETQYQFQVPTLVITPEEIQQAVLKNPFITHPDIDETTTYFTFLKDHPTPDGVTAFEACSYPNETFILQNKVVYYHCKLGYGKAKFTNKLMEKKLGTRATTRNFKTTMKLISMTQG